MEVHPHFLFLMFFFYKDFLLFLFVYWMVMVLLVWLGFWMARLMASLTVAEAIVVQW